MAEPIMSGYHNRRLGDPFPWGPETGKDVKLEPGATLVGVRLGGGSDMGQLHEFGRGEENSQTTSSSSLSAEIDLFASRIPLVENKLQFHGADGVGLKYSYVARLNEKSEIRDHRIDLLYRLMFGEKGEMEAFVGPTFMMGDTMEYGYGGVVGALYRFNEKKGSVPFLGLRMMSGGGNDLLGTTTLYTQAGLFGGLEFSGFVGE